MFGDSRSDDPFTRHLASAWSLYLLLGLNLILLALCIMIFPALLAYLVAAFLLFDGVVFLMIAFQLRRLARPPARWRAPAHAIPQ